MRWQSRADFAYALATGYIGAFPASYRRFPTLRMEPAR